MEGIKESVSCCINFSHYYVCDLLTGSLFIGDSESSDSEALKIRTKPSQLSQYASHLRKMYLKHPIGAHSSSAATLTEKNGSSRTYTNQRLKDLCAIVSKKSERFILIEGAPGVGKTALSQFICMQWGKGILLKKFQAVIYVDLCDPQAQNPVSVVAMLYKCECKPACQQAVADDIVANGGEGVLWILDGFDRLPSAIRRSKDSLLIKLLQGTFLKNSSVIVTLRPEAIDDVLNACKSQKLRHLQLLPNSVAQVQEDITGDIISEQDDTAGKVKVC